MRDTNGLTEPRGNERHDGASLGLGQQHDIDPSAAYSCDNNRYQTYKSGAK